MSNYTKATNFAAKDALPVGDANKKVKGVEVDNEFNAIANAVSTKADLQSPTFTGIPAVPTAVAGTNTTQVASTAFVTTAVTASIPSGVIVMWSGSVVSIPSGWALCDGNNSTPDLRNRFVVGAGDTYAVDATGGSADAVVVSHTHTLTDPGHAHTSQVNQDHDNDNALTIANKGGNNTSDIRNISTSTATTGISIASAGQSGTNANLPPYYALAYIMKT